MFAFTSKEKLKVDDFIELTSNGLDIVHLPTKLPFTEFKRNCVSTFNGYTFDKEKNFKLQSEVWQNYVDGHSESYNQEDVNQLNRIKMQEIPTNVEVVQCQRLENLQEGMQKVSVEVKQNIPIKFVIFRSSTILNHSMYPIFG